MAQQLRALVIFPKDLCLILSTRQKTAGRSQLELHLQGIQHPLFWPWTPGTYAVHKHTRRQNTHMHKRTKQKKINSNKCP